MVRGKDYRRYKAECKRKRVRYIVDIVWGNSNSTTWPKEERESYIRRSFDHWPKCSCYLCGNPRRTFGILTKREKLALLSDQDMSGSEYITHYHTRSRFVSYK
jgi:hypothetical protein